MFTSSCAVPTDPTQIPDYGLSACAVTDGGIPPWSPDMSGRVIRSMTVPVTAGTNHVSIPLDSAAFTALAAKGSALISFETPNDEVQAFDVPLAQAAVTITQSSTISYQGDPVTLSATVTGTNPFPGPPTGQVQFTVDNNPIGAPVALDGSGNASLVTTALPLGTHQVRARYLGDGDYAAVDSAPVSHLTVVLSELHNLINGFGLDPVLATSAEHGGDAGGEAGRARLAPLPADLREARRHAGGGTRRGRHEGARLRRGHAAARRDQRDRRQVRLRHGRAADARRRSTTCTTMMGTIAGMGLAPTEASDLIGMTRDVGKKIVDHQSYQTCKKLGDLLQRIANDTGKPGKLTTAQGTTLTAAAAAIGTELDC